MSTPDSSGVDFAVVPEEHHQHFRLLELPPELLDLLTSEDPPLLHLKAPEGPAGQPLDSNAVLCTPDKTYNIRQVSTSNTLFITETTSRSDAASNGIPHPRIEAIGKAISTLEVLPTNNTNVSAHAAIKATLPVFTSTGHSGSNKSITKRELFDNIPLSEAECEASWLELACFELSDPLTTSTTTTTTTRSFVPSPATRWQVWQSVKTVAEAEGVNVTRSCSDAERAILIEGVKEEAPTELVTAVLRSMSAKWSEEGFELDAQKCVQFTGTSLLREKAGSGGNEASINTSEFTSAWKEKVPHQWENLADVPLLAPHYRLDDGGRSIVYIDSDEGAKNGVAATETKSTMGAKRKWHEKFRASKKAA